MHTMHVESRNLNDLAALHALVATRSVSDAARRMGISQSAMSHALGRLRASFDDPLFVRTARGLVPTERCTRLAPRLEAAMAELDAVLAVGDSFDPASSTRRFRIAASDAALALGLGRLLTELRRDAPGIDVVLSPVSERSSEAVVRGTLDILVGGPSDAPRSGTKTRVLFEDTFVVLARNDHPLFHHKLDAAAYAACAHVVVSRDERPSFVDHALRAHGLARRVVLRVPDFGLVGEVAEQSDLVATVPSRLARWMSRRWSVRSRRVPIALPAFSARAYLHARTEQDPAIAWLLTRLEATMTKRIDPRRSR